MLRRAFAILVLFGLGTARCQSQAFILETKFGQELYRLHFAESLKKTGQPWDPTLWDHQFHVVDFDGVEWVVFMDQVTPMTELRTWTLCVHQEDGSWKQLPYSVGGVDSRFVPANRDRIVHRLHLEHLPGRIVDDLLNTSRFRVFIPQPIQTQ